MRCEAVPQGVPAAIASAESGARNRRDRSLTRSVRHASASCWDLGTRRQRQSSRAEARLSQSLRHASEHPLGAPTIQIGAQLSTSSNERPIVNDEDHRLVVSVHRIE